MIVATGMTVFSRSNWKHSMHEETGDEPGVKDGLGWRRKSDRRYVEVADYFATGNEDQGQRTHTGAVAPASAGHKKGFIRRGHAITAVVPEEISRRAQF